MYSCQTWIPFLVPHKNVTVRYANSLDDYWLFKGDSSDFLVALKILYIFGFFNIFSHNTEPCCTLCIKTGFVKFLNTQK